MKEKQLRKCDAFRWKQFNHKAYSVFCSLKKEVNIGVLTFATLAFANVSPLSAQTEVKTTDQSTVALDEIEVTGSRVPLTELESAKMVTVLSQQEIQAAAVHSVNDLLKYAVGIDVRQRGEFGIQTDISIQGGTFDQITILINGVNINNPQTGHLSADFPVSLSDIERIEILEGGAARIFGTSAFSGAINIVTKSDPQSHIAVDLMTGYYGLFKGGGRANYTKGSFSHQVSGSFSRTDGATTNSDFKTGKAYYQGVYGSKQADIKWQLGLSDRKYGANTFYTAAFPSQYEETNRLFASIQAETKGWLHLTPTIYWNRSYDHFQLIKDTPKVENFHQADVYGLNLNAYFTSFLGKTAFGAEFRNEGILSTNLGKPLDEDHFVKVPGQKEIFFDKKDNRTSTSYYAEHNVVLSNFTLSAGVLATMNTALDHKYRFYPGVDISYRPSIYWKLYASWNKSLRMPTFTDLYYKSPTQEGNIGLKPEKNNSFSLGATYRKSYFRADLSAFYNHGKDMIDWVMYTENDKYHSANFELKNMGLEGNWQLNFQELIRPTFPLRKISLGYSYIYQDKKDPIEIYKSNYALEYLRHKLVAQIDHTLWSKLSASWAFRWQDRMGSYISYSKQGSTGVLTPYSSYALMDLKLSWDADKYQIYGELNNLFDKEYYDLGNVPQPGIWGKIGFTYRINFK